MEKICQALSCISIAIFLSRGLLATNSAENLSLPDVHSPHYLNELAKHENFVYIALTDLARNHSSLFSTEDLTKIEEYLHFYNKDVALSQKHGGTASSSSHSRMIAQNPILVLNMVWRFANHLRQIYERIQRINEGSCNVFLDGVDDRGKNFIKDIKSIKKWPTKRTVEEAMIGLLRIQMVYDLDAQDISVGRIYGVDTGARLTIAFIYALGKLARDVKMYYLAIAWLELTWENLNLLKYKATLDKSTQISLMEVEADLIAAVKEHDIEFEQPDSYTWKYLFTEKLFQIKRKNETPPEEIIFPVRSSDWTSYQRLNHSYNEINYWGLCSGENHQTEKEKAQLTCWYDRTTDPSLFISPVKKEMLSKIPYIVLMYDVISESAINDLVSKANKQKPVRSKVLIKQKPFDGSQPEHGRLSGSEIRTSVESFLKDPLPKLGRFIEASTGLSVVSPNSSENYLVASYAFGGHYDCHLDPREDETTIATMMFYLEDTQLGGLTVFPQAGVAAKPIKGSAVFWYSLKRNGETDFLTYHCACPVVIGQKTIATKWIRYHAQFQRRPCGIREGELCA